MGLHDREERNFNVQPTLKGGLSPNSDILKQRDTATWLDCQNMIVSNPTGYLSGVSPKDTVTTPPPTLLFGDSTYTTGQYNAPIWTKTIATFENTDWPNETWAFSGTGTASLVTSITEGDQSLSLDNAASQTATGTCTLPSSIDLSSPTYSILAIDLIYNGNFANFSSGYIRIGSDSSNYRQYALPTPSSANLTTVKFDFGSPTSTTGTPNLAAIQYVQVSMTATATIGGVTGKYDNLRLASFSSSSSGNLNLVSNGSNVYSSFVYDEVVSTSSAIIYVSGDTIFRFPVTSTTSPLAATIKSGFKNTSPASGGTNFYFSQFQKTGSSNQNILYYVNGSDGYFSYDQNASIGSRDTRIDSTNYKYICSHKNMMFLAGSSSKPNTVQPSDVNDPTTLTAANAVLVPDISGSYVTGLISMDEYLAILRSDGIWKLYGSNPDSAATDFQLIRSQAKTGCLEQKMACRVGKYIYYFDGSDIYRFNGDTSECISDNMDTKLTGYNAKLCSIWYNPLRDLVIFNFVPSTVPDPVSTKTTYYQLAYCISANAWGEMGEYDNANSVQFGGMFWGGANYSKPLSITYGLQFYQIDPPTPTDISMPWFLKTQWNDANRPDIIKDYSQFTWYFRDQVSRNTPTARIDMYSDFDPDNIKQTFNSQNEIVTISGSAAPNAGNWKIVFGGYTTASLAYNDSAATIQSALEALTSIGSGNISVSGTLATTVTLTFIGSLAATDVGAVTITDNTLTSSGTAVTLNVNVSQDGNAFTPTNNSLQLLTTGVSGRSISSKISGTCTDQRDAAVMISGYSHIWSEIEDV